MNTAQDKKHVDHNGYWYIENNPISRTGVFPYLGKQISDELEPDKVYQVYRPAEELFSPEAMASFKLMPLVDDHTMLGKDYTPAEQKGIEGVLGEKIERSGDMLTADIKIYSESLKDEIRNGKKELSLGYFCDYDLTPGTYKGQHYDAVQRNLRGNHIALVDKGRMGREVRVMDKSLNMVKNCPVHDSISIDDEWTTVHPNGKENKGQPVKLDDEGTIATGMGGKFNGLHIGMVAQGRNESKKGNGGNSEEEKKQITAEQEQIKKGYEETKNNPDKGTISGMYDVLTTMQPNLKTYIIHRGATTRNEKGELVVRGRRLERDRGTARNFGFSKMIFAKGLTVEEMCQLPLFIRDYEPAEITESGRMIWRIPTGDIPYKIVFNTMEKNGETYFLAHMSKDPRSTDMEKSKKKKGL